MKLSSLVQATSDPELLEYALKNLGRGVSNHACFGPALSALRQKWQYWLAMQRTPVFLALYERQISIGLLKLSSIAVFIRELRIDDEITLRKKLRDPNRFLRLLTMDAVARRRCHLEADLIERLEEPDPTTQEAAHRALVSVARGTDFGPFPGASQRGIERSIEKWKQWLALQQSASAETLAKEAAIAAAGKRTNVAPLEIVPLILVDEQQQERQDKQK